MKKSQLTDPQEIWVERIFEHHILCRTSRAKPQVDSTLSQHPMIGGTQQMASDSEEIQDDSVDRQESLGLSGGLEPPHLSLSLSGWLVRDLSPIVGVSAGVVED